MKLPPVDVRTAQQRIDAVTQSEVLDVADDAKVEAGAHVLELVKAQLAGADPLSTGERVWSRSKLVAGSIESKSHAALDGFLAGASLEELGGLVDALALQMTASEGKEAALSRLLDLKVVLGAGSAMAMAYNYRIKGTPARLRGGEQLSPELVRGLEALSEAIGNHIRKADAEHAVDLSGVRKVTAGASGLAWAGGARLFKGARGLLEKAGGDGLISKVGEVASAAADKALEAIPATARNVVKELKTNAASLLGALNGVGDDVGDRDAVVGRFLKALPAAAVAIDPSADGFAVGLLQEATAGLTGSAGHEIVYNKAKGELQVKKLETAGLRVGVGGTHRVFARSLFGDKDAIDGVTERSEREAGAGIAHLRKSNAVDSKSGREVESLGAMISMGFTLGIPVVVDASLNSISEIPVGDTIKLTPAEIEAIDSAVGTAPRNEWIDSVRDFVRDL